MDQPNPRPPYKFGFFGKLLLRIAGVDEETLRLCPQQDVDNVRAVAELMIFTWLYETGLFSIAAHKIFDIHGQIRLELIFVSMFLAAFILSIDSCMIMRAGWYASGLLELIRGGIDVSGGLAARVKAGIFLAIRIFLSIVLAQLTAVFLGIIFFSSDIAPLIQSDYVEKNAGIIASATSQADDQIKQATETLDAETVRESALASQVNALRQNKIDPSASRTDIQEAVQETAQAMLRKKAADEELRRAQRFASDELAGVRGTQDNSGIPGDGPVRRAAVEAVANAKSEAEQASAALNAAQSRLDAMRQQSVATNEAARQQSDKELPKFETILAEEERKVRTLRDNVDRLTRNRDDAIRNAVENAPNHISSQNGLLSQIRALEHLAQNDPKIGAIIILIDLASFGFELAAVLAKVTSYVPTMYSALLARDAYMRTVRIVDGMMEELNSKNEENGSDVEAHRPFTQAPKPPGNTSPAAGEDPFGNASGVFFPVVKRSRGRPPKTPTNDQPGNPLPFDNEPT